MHATKLRNSPQRNSLVHLQRLFYDRMKLLITSLIESQRWMLIAWPELALPKLRKISLPDRPELLRCR